MIHKNDRPGRLSTPLSEFDARGMRWFAVNTLPNSESRALINLERQGWRCFCPRLSRTTRSGRRMKTELRALFPGYVFVLMNPEQSRWRSIDGTFGVRAIVKSGDLPAPVPVGVIDALMQMSDSDGRVSFAATLRAGQDVRFLAGPLAGLIGKLEHLSAGGRVVVLLELLGRSTTIRSYASEVAPAGRTQLRDPGK